MIYFVKKNFCLLLAQKCRPIYCVLNSPKYENWIWTRRIGRFFVGICVAMVLYGIFLLNTEYSVESVMIILGLMASLIGIGFLCNVSIQCISFLILVGMAGKSGRSYLRALFFVYIISGPITNLAANGEEIVRVFACATTLTYNLTKTRLDFMLKPFQNTLSNMIDDLTDLENSFEKMSPILKPIRDEVETQNVESNFISYGHGNETLEEYVERTYTKKFEIRCKRQIKKGELRCRAAFAIAYDQCKSQFPLIVRTILCWPFKVSFICGMNLFGSPNDLCTPGEALPNDFGNSYVQLNDAQRQLNQKESKVEVKYKEKSTILKAAQRSSDRTAGLVVEEINAKKEEFNILKNCMQMLLSLLFFKVIVDSIMYHARYLNKIDFDNLYITDYFRQIDDRRKKALKLTILPLKKFEHKKIVDLRRACEHTEEESKIVVFHFIQFSLETLAAFFFLMLDYLIVALLDIIRLKSFLSYVQDGEHIISFQVQGNGLVAKLLRKTLRNFNMHEKVSTYLSNEACLPNPNVVSNRHYLKIAATFGIIVVLIYKSSFLLRMRRLICSYFYNKREKQRIVYLYNVLLQKRRTLLEVLRQVAENNIVKKKLRQRINFELVICLRWRLGCRWSKLVPIAQLRCLICDELKDNDFIICKNSECRMGYCYQCWRDIGVKCISCKNDIKTIEILDFNIFFEPIDLTQP